MFERCGAFERVASVRGEGSVRVSANKIALEEESTLVVGMFVGSSYGHVTYDRILRLTSH